MTTFKVILKNKHTSTEVIKYKRAEDQATCLFMINNQYGLHYDPVSVVPIATDPRTPIDE
jgi:hypothetical protein